MNATGEQSMTSSSSKQPTTRNIPSRELTALRKQLADAWWNEALLETIQGLEARIQSISRSNQSTNA